MKARSSFWAVLRTHAKERTKNPTSNPGVDDGPQPSRIERNKFSCCRNRFPHLGFPNLSVIILLLVVAATILLPQRSQAQESRGTISGSVTDPTGASIPGAQITATEVDSGAVSRTRSNAQGQYTVPFLQPGHYEIKAEKAGFKRIIHSRVTLHASSHLIIDLQMQVGSTEQTVTVTAAAPLLNTTNASIGQTISTKEVADLPLNGRTPLMLAELAMGVFPTSQPSQVHPFDNAGAAAWSIGGTPSQSSEVLMDGAPDELWDGEVAYNPPMSTVKEVSVRVFDTNAAYGHAVGGVLNQVLKSGTNQIHGTLYEYGQASALDANSYFNSRHRVPIAVTHFNQYGLEAAGPVLIPKLFNGRNKLFWLFAWEGLRDSQPSTTITTVPTTQERQGDFSALLPVGCPSGYQNGNPAICANGKANPYQLYNPFTATQQNGTITRTPIPNNDLASAGIPLSPVAKSYIKYYPNPNITGGADGFGNYITNPPSVDNFDNFLGRLDFNIGSKTHMFFDFRRNLRSTIAREYLNPGNVTTGSFHNVASGITVTRSNWGATFDAVHTFNPTTVLDFRVNWNYYLQTVGEPSDGLNPSALGFPSYMASQSEKLTMPYIYFRGCGSSNFECLGGTGAQRDSNNDYQLWTEIMKTVGKHSLSFGIDARQYRLRPVNYGYSSGEFYFGPTWVQETNASAAPKFAGDFASFMMGLPTSGEYQDNVINSLYNYYLGAFIQDNWRLNNQLTINIGLRFDHNTPWRDRHGRLVNGFASTTPNPIAGAAEAAYAANPIPEIPVGDFKVNGGLTFPSAHDGAYYQLSSHELSPRIGFAWTPKWLDSKTVVSGGFGMFVTPFTISDFSPFYGKYSTNPLLMNAGFSATTPFVATNNDYLSPAATLDNPFPNGFLPATGSAAGLKTLLGQSITFLNPHPDDPYSLRWDLGIQQLVTPDVMFQISYIGNHYVHMPVETRQLNGVPDKYLSTATTRDQAVISELTAGVPNPFHNLIPGTTLNGTTTSVAQLLTAFPEFPQNGVTEYNASTGQSFFNSLDVRIERREFHGLWLLANYGWSKLETEDSYLNPSDPHPDKHLAPFDYTNHILLSATYDLPFGSGKAINLTNRWMNEFFGGWTMNGIYTWQTGPPIYWNYDMVTTGKPIEFNSRQTANGVPAISRDAFDLNSAAQFDYHLRTFPITFSQYRSNGINNLDASVLKTFSIYRNTSFQLRFETFNTLNHPMFGSPNVDPYSSEFGDITSQSNTSRQVQIGGTLVF